MGWMANLIDKKPAKPEPKPKAPRAPRKAARMVEAPATPALAPIEVEPVKMPAITARQIRAARALLGIGQEEAAALSGIARPVYTRIENGTVRGRADTLDKIEAGFREAGIELIYAGDGKGEGVRMASPEGKA